MSPKEKAKEIFNKFWPWSADKKIGVNGFHYDYNFHKARTKQCALIAVQEIIDEGVAQYGAAAVDYGREKFWHDVKKELENI